MFALLQRWDVLVLLTIQNWHNPVLDFLMPIITHLGSGGILWIALAITLLFFKKTRKFGILIGVSLLLSMILGNYILKPLVARPRPFETVSGVSMLITPPDGYSFPSGHTITSFAAATVLWFRSWKLALPATIVASLIGFSRMYLFCHYLTDVAAGALLGAAVAVAVVLLYRWTLGRRYPLQPQH